MINPSFIAKRTVSLVVYFFSGFFKRNGKKVVLSSWGDFSDSPKYFLLLLKEMKLNEDDEVSFIWITQNKCLPPKMKSIGLSCYYRYSLCGIYHLLTSGWYIYTNNVTDLSYMFSRNAKLFNFWHGVPLKKIEFSIETGVFAKKYKDNFLNRFSSPARFVKTDFILSTSNKLAPIFMDAFRVDESSVVSLGYPRCDYLNANEHIRKSILEKYHDNDTVALVDKLSKYDKVVTYMPTFRDDGLSILETSGFDFESINNLMVENNSLLILKFHPHTSFNHSLVSKFSNVISLDSKFDSYPILPYVDILVTDYSSIYFDFLSMPDKDVLLFPYDIDHYKEKNRDFYFDYDSVFVADKTFCWDEFLNALSFKLKNEPKNELPSDFIERSDFSSTERIFKFINNSL